MGEAPQPTGQLDDRDPGWIVIPRTLEQPIEELWAAITEPQRLRAWIGTWDGDPAAGHVAFAMTAEGEDVPAETFHIDECAPPRLLAVHSTDPDGGRWEMRLELSEQAGATTLAFAQRVTDPEIAATVGPGWEYYLDRLVAAETGADVATLDFDDYYPSLADHYRRLVR